METRQQLLSVQTVSVFKFQSSSVRNDADTTTTDPTTTTITTISTAACTGAHCTGFHAKTN